MHMGAEKGKGGKKGNLYQRKRSHQERLQKLAGRHEEDERAGLAVCRQEADRIDHGG